MTGNRATHRAAFFTLAMAGTALATPALAQDAAVDARIEALEARIEALEAQNRQLVDLVRQQQAAQASAAEAASQASTAPSGQAAPVGTASAQSSAAANNSLGTGLVGIDSAYAFQMLDVAENVDTKPLIQLQTIQQGRLSDRITLSGGLTAIADYQISDKPSKFGYLTRHPTSGNQVGKHVSEAVIHSAELAVTGRLTQDLTGYFELLYDPEQSFGSGTLTDLNRNQIQLRRGWIMWGNLDKRPVYALIGKMDIPFGFNGTVSPFTPSTNYHAFAGLAYGAQLGYFGGGVHVRAMAIQGGAQFRSANTPVKGTNVPSRLNNFALDANYTLALSHYGSFMLGGSYQHGTAYCQVYPVAHFNQCPDNTPAWAAYGVAKLGGFTLMGQYAQTTKVWQGTEVPQVDPRIGTFVSPPQQIWLVSPNPLSIFDAKKPRSFSVGGRYEFGAAIPSPQRRKNAVSLEFSRFIAGANDSPWEGQSQTVLGLSRFITPSVNLFGEVIYVDGFVPLNFLSGGNFADGSTWSDQGVDNELLVLGVQAAF